MVKKSRVFLAFVVGLLAGLGGETLLLMERQFGSVERVLSDDFRLILFLKAEPDAARRKVIEDQLLAIDGVEEARYVSRQDAMANLRREDPELVESVGVVSDSPLDASFELRLREEAVGRVPQLIEQAQALAEFSDVRYKPVQVQAILQAKFYARLINVALAAMVCLAAVLALWGLWAAARPTRSGLAGGAAAWKAWAHTWTSAATSALGAAVGGTGACALILPVKIFGPAWSAWPTPDRQAALLGAAAMAGWVLCGLSF